MNSFRDALSEIEDDPEPEVYQSSGEEWNVNTEKPLKFRQRSSQRLKKKSLLPPTVDIGDSSDSETSVKSKSRNGAKRQKITKRAPPVGSKILNKDFLTGGFLVLKKDLQTGDTKKHPCLWRIDGKALLQKYEPLVDVEGKIRHKSTSIYTGWSALDKDQYSPVSVDVLEHQALQMIVELHWDTIRNVNMDSD